MNRTKVTITSVVSCCGLFHELLSRDREDGRATGKPSRGTAGLVIYVAGAGTRGRTEGRPYPWSQQVIHEISGLIICRGVFFISTRFLRTSQVFFPLAAPGHQVSIAAGGTTFVNRS